MVLASLKEAFGLIGSRPVLWVPGLVTGLLVFVDLLSEYYRGSFLVGKLGGIELLVIPFLAGGLLFSIKTGEINTRTFFRGGVRYYFRILLPGIVIMFAATITIFLLMVPLTIIGTGALYGIIAGAVVGVLVPFIFFTYFFDAVAVFGETKVFETIRRSIELAVRNAGLIIKFFLVNIVILLAGSFFLLMAWTTVLTDRLTPLTTMNATELSTITPEVFVGILGADGIIMSAVILAVGTAILITILYTYKACFFRTLSGITPQTDAPVPGEYDSKGRWYKY